MLASYSASRTTICRYDYVALCQATLADGHRGCNGDNNGPKTPHVTTTTTTTTGLNKKFYTKLEVVPGEEPHFRAFSYPVGYTPYTSSLSVVAILEVVICLLEPIWGCRRPLSLADLVIFHALSELKKLNKRTLKRISITTSCNFSRSSQSLEEKPRESG